MKTPFAVVFAYDQPMKVVLSDALAYLMPWTVCVELLVNDQRSNIKGLDRGEDRQFAMLWVSPVCVITDPLMMIRFCCVFDCWKSHFSFAKRFEFLKFAKIKSNPSLPSLCEFLNLSLCDTVLHGHNHMIPNQNDSRKILKRDSEKFSWRSNFSWRIDFVSDEILGDLSAIHRVSQPWLEIFDLE